MPTRQTIVLVSFLAIAGVALGFSRLLSGGSDTQVVGRALMRAAETRRFIGTISVAVAPQTDLPVASQGAATAGYAYTAKGHFAVAPGQALTGAWSVSLGSLRDDVADQPLMDMAVTEGGSLFLRTDEIPAGLALPTEWQAGTGGKWVASRAADLWPPAEQRDLDAAAKWNELVDAVLRGEVFAVAGRKPSEFVGGLPSWRFALDPTAAGAVRLAAAVEELRLGRRLTDDEAKASAAAVVASRPAADLWVDKASGELRRLVISYMTAPTRESSAGSAVSVSLNFAAWTPYEPTTPPEVE